MPIVPDPQALQALFRFLGARLGLDATALLLLEPAATRVAIASPAYAALRAGDDPLAALDPMAGARMVDPRALGLPPGFAAIQPVLSLRGTAWALVAHDRRPRRFGPALSGPLADAALLLAPLIADAAPTLRPTPPMARPTDPASPVRGAILPREAAHRLIESAFAATTGPAPLILIIDLDRFRSINEALGLAAGDALLAVTGTRLENALGSRDRLARLEGDRFLVVAQAGPEPPDRLAARLLEVIRQPLSLAGRRITMQASIGVVATPTRVDPAAIPHLLARADGTMRRAKAEGRNRYALHEPRLDAASLEQSQLELDLAGAPAAGQMYLSYQPFVALDTGAIAGVEALMRWRHPTRGEVRPTTFIPLAESTGLILPLGLWALRTACRAALGWSSDLLLAVNISALQFHQRNFISQIDQVLAETGFPPERLELEITETVLMRDNPETLGQMRALIARGIHIALDDFGTGYSALAYLARLPHHRIKLDKSFVGDLANPATADLIRAIVAQARANGIDVTAEGVERPEQLAQVRAMGFTHAQGYATGAPGEGPSTIALAARANG